MVQNLTYMAAIDIGTTKTVAIIGKKDSNNEIEILGFGTSLTKGVNRGVVINIEEASQSIKKAVDKAGEMASLKTDNLRVDKAIVGIAGQHVRSVGNRGARYIDSPDSEIKLGDVELLRAEMYKMLVEIGEKIIHVIPQNYIIDNADGVINPVGISGKRLEGNYHIIIAQSASCKNIEKCVNRIDIEMIDLVFEPIAAAEAVLTADEKEAGVVLVDIGGGTTDIAIYHDSIIRHSAVIPFGGNVVTSDIKEGCSILQRQAEQLKQQFGSALGDLVEENKIVSIPGISGREPKEISFKNLSYIIQSRMEEIVEAINFEIKNSQIADKLSAGIVITGGSANLINLSELVKLQTGYDVRIGKPVGIIIDDNTKELNEPEFSTVVGLLLDGFKYHNGINILQNENEEEEEEIDDAVENESTGGFFSSIKNKFKDILDDKEIENQ